MYTSSNMIYDNSPETKCSAYQINLDETAIKWNGWKILFAPLSFRIVHTEWNVDCLGHIRINGYPTERVHRSRIEWKWTERNQFSVNNQLLNVIWPLLTSRTNTTSVTCHIQKWMNASHRKKIVYDFFCFFLAKPIKNALHMYTKMSRVMAIGRWHTTKLGKHESFAVSSLVVILHHSRASVRMNVVYQRHTNTHTHTTNGVMNVRHAHVYEWWSLGVCVLQMIQSRFWI